MLTDIQTRKAKAADRSYKLTDGGGLHVCVTPAGGKLWRLRYEFNRAEKLLSIGPYPPVGVAKARVAATSAKRLLRKGKDPAVEKRLGRLSTQALDVIKVLRKLTGRTPYPFPDQRHARRPARENAIGYLPNRAGVPSSPCAAWDGAQHSRP
jgi:hypothetical protein